MKKKGGLQIRGLVTVKQGDKVLFRDKLNHFVDSGLKGLLSTIMSADSTLWDVNGWAYSWNEYLGSDTATPTSTTMTALVSPIGTAPGTPPNSRSISGKDGSTDGIWNMVFLCTWNAGTVSGTVGELALYLRPPDKTNFGWTVPSSPWTPSVVMVSRLSSADADFSSFIIDATVPLTVEWKVQLSFV